MGDAKRPGKGELILLGIFGVFMIAYLADIRGLPWEATLLSYILAPFILFLITLLSLKALFRGRERESEDKEQEDLLECAKKKTQSTRLMKTLSMLGLLFVSIFFLGFYLGSGLTLLIWFLIFRRVTIGTVILVLTIPLLLYLTFEVVMDFALHEGQIFVWFSD